MTADLPERRSTSRVQLQAKSANQMTRVAETTDSSFEYDVLRSNQLVLVEFWAPWCTPSRAVSPMVDQIAEDYAGRITVFRVNIDENSILAREYVRTPPVVCLFKNGIKVDIIMGVGKDSLLRRSIDLYL